METTTTALRSRATTTVCQDGKSTRAVLFADPRLHDEALGIHSHEGGHDPERRADPDGHRQRAHDRHNRRDAQPKLQATSRGACVTENHDRNFKKPFEPSLWKIVGTQKKAVGKQRRRVLPMITQ
jgi:hypothetical protein